MGDIINQITPWFAGLSPILILIIGILLYKPENLKKWASLLWYPFGAVMKFTRKSAVKNELEYKFGTSLKNINADITEFEFPQLSIKWVSKENISSILDEELIIVPLDFKKDKQSNLINLTAM